MARRMHLVLVAAEGNKEFLTSKPESGMGYQVVWVNVGPGESSLYLAFNAELLVSVEELPKELPSYDRCIATAQQLSRSARVDIVPATEMLPVFWKHPFLAFKRAHTEQPDALSRHYTTATATRETFKRFSATPNDNRVGPDGSLRAGTYATTENDVKVVPSGLAAVPRYALPIPWPARSVFTIRPPASTSILCGTVEPRFAQSGGGVEVYFPKELPPGCVVLPPDLLDER